MSAEWNESRTESDRKFRMQRQMEMENEQDEYGRRESRYNQDQDEWRNNTQSQTGRHESEATFPVRSVSDGGTDYGNRFVRINGLNETNPIYKLERMLRTYYPETQSHPDEFRCIRPQNQN